MSALLVEVLGRPWCHLCHDLVDALRPLLPPGAQLRQTDLEDDTPLEERWGELIPVLFINGEYICHYHLDEAAVRAKLAEFPVTSAT